MFKGMGNLQQLMQQAQQMSKKLEQVKAGLKDKRESFTSGGGAVAVTVNGNMELVSITIDPEAIKGAVEDASMLQDLVLSAVNGAIQKMQATVQSQMKDAAGGLPLPNLGF